MISGGEVGRAPVDRDVGTRARAGRRGAADALPGGIRDSYRRPMTRKPLRCRFGFHAWVQRHPEGDRPARSEDKICRRCGKRTGSPFGSAPWVFPG
ncbi:hypothetical protein GCM10023328_20700 [Modestobacter marinus]|uniref:Uncharacterized protein n=2 Tax=Modestobacter marinus TaxID=477641 RepID=A0ABQ2FYE9_9ACTN|nr:hypothetical protein GCM10011589_22910 [Modestobacter marinus]